MNSGKIVIQPTEKLKRREKKTREGGKLEKKINTRVANKGFGKTKEELLFTIESLISFISTFESLTGVF